MKIKFENITKRFKDVTAVKNLTMEIREGEFMVFVGPSGCGKTTTLRMVAGLESITEGTLWFNDTEMNGVKPADRNVAMVFQNYALYPHMNARENMVFGIHDSGSFSEEEVERRVTEASSTLGISDLLERKPGELSGGEKQRVSIGRAMVRDPDVFLMDEPLSNLDAKLRLEMRAELADLHTKLETTTVYVTHDQTEAMTLGDRVAVLADGTLQQVDPPQKLYDFPETRFVAEFIGNPGMNIVSTTLEKGNHEYSVEHSSITYEIEIDELDQQLDSDILLGFRPESLFLSDRAESEDGPKIEVEVTAVESLGNFQLVHGTTDGQDVVAEVPPRVRIQKGDQIPFSIKSDRIHIFDPQTEKAIYHSGSRESLSRTERVPVNENP